jgi:LuxR family maltose regulon positive regulatory protein
MNGCGYGGEELILAESAFFKGDISSAEELSQKALAKARQKNQYEIENRALFFLLRLYLHRGDCRLIPKLLSQVEALLDMRWYNNRYIYHDLFTGWFYVQTGQSEKIAGWLKNDFEKNELYPMLTPFENLLKAKFYFAQKRYPATLAILGKGGQGKYTGGTSLLGTLERELLEAVCRYRLDDREGAFQKLEKAWELAVASGFWMPFAELGKDMRALAAAALKAGSTKIPHSDLEKIRSSAAVYAKKLFAVSDQYSYSANAGKEKAGLSDREKSVLVGLSQGLTREEIAKASSISINTVKSAIRNLYHKLGAVNRANAIRIAAERGIL